MQGTVSTKEVRGKLTSIFHVFALMIALGVTSCSDGAKPPVAAEPKEKTGSPFFEAAQIADLDDHIRKLTKEIQSGHGTGEGIDALYCRRGAAYLTQGFDGLALEDFKQVTRGDSEFFEPFKQNLKKSTHSAFKKTAYIGIGLAASRAGNHQAFYAFQKAQLLDPAYGDAYAGSALEAVMRVIPGTRNPKAKEDGAKAVRLSPESGFARFCHGMAILKADQRNRFTVERGKAALSEFDQAIACQPRNSLFYSMRGLCLLTLGDAQGALTECRQALELNPSTPEAFFVQGLAYQTLEQPNEAIEAWTRCAAFQSKDGRFAQRAVIGDAIIQRGIAKYRLGKTEEALQDLAGPTEAHCTQWLRGEALYLTGLIHANAGRLEEAERAMLAVVFATPATVELANQARSSLASKVWPPKKAEQEITERHLIIGALLVFGGLAVLDASTSIQPSPSGESRLNRSICITCGGSGIVAKRQFIKRGGGRPDGYIDTTFGPCARCSGQGFK